MFVEDEVTSSSRAGFASMIWIFRFCSASVGGILQMYMRFALGVARGKYMIACLNFVADTWVHCLCSYCKFLL
jgi:hypothetical protein